MRFLGEIDSKGWDIGVWIAEILAGIVTVEGGKSGLLDSLEFVSLFFD